MKRWLSFLLLGGERLLICFPIMESCQGICKVLIAIWKARSWMPTYVHCSVYASAYTWVHKNILLWKAGFCWHFFSRLHDGCWSHTPEPFPCASWLWQWMCPMRVEVRGKNIKKIVVPSRPSVFCCCSLCLLFTPGCSVWHIFSHWNFWSSVATALCFPPQATSLSALDNFNTVIDTCELPEIPHVIPGAQAAA